MKPIPLFGTGMKSYSQVVTSQRRLNCFYDIRVDQDKSAIIIQGTPGSFRTFTIPEYPIRGWVISGFLIYVVAGKSLYTVSLGGAISFIGAIPTANQFVSIADNGVEITVVDGVAGYVYNYVTGVYNGQITDPAFPNGCNSVAHLDSRLIAEYPNSRQFGVSQQLAGGTWSPTLFASKENYSDYISAIDVLNGLLILWGYQSIEYWQDAGLVPQPFQRVQGATQTWGLAARYSRSFIDNTMMFLGQNTQGGGVQVMKLNGYTPNRVSNSDIESIIASFPVYADAVSLTYVVNGHAMYQITFPNANRSFLYDCSTNIWYEVQTGVALIDRHFANLGIAFAGKNYVCDNSTGNVYQLDMKTYTDNGTTIKRQLASRHIRMGGNEFTMDELILEMETGVGLTSGQGSNPQVMMQVSRDGGRTFGAERWKTLGMAGQYKSPRVKYDRLGDARDFVFMWTMTDPVPFVVTLGEGSSRQGPES